MSDSNVGQQLIALLKYLATATFLFARRKTIPLIVSAVLVLIAWQGWQAFTEFRSERLTLLVGPLSSGQTVEEAERIKSEMENLETGLMGKRYTVNLVGTTGYEENRKRIDADEEGQLFGFAYDGFVASENVAIVLPLDKRYLHILCRKEFLKTDVATDATQPGSPSLKQIYDALRSGRVYLGTPQSATRQCAEIVLKHFGRDPEELRCFGVGDFDQMRSALARGHIDMAFSSSLFNDEDIRKIAKDDNCILLGLNGERDAIVQENRFLIAVDFEPTSYRSGGFCAERQESIGARRVLICSSKMSPQDAYVAGLCSAEALRNRVPDIEWGTSPLGADKTRDAPLRFRLHPGADLFRLNQKPNGDFQWMNALLSTVSVWGVFEFLRWINSLLASRLRVTKPELPDEAAVSPAAVTQSPEAPVMTELDDRELTFIKLKKDLDTQVHEWERAPLLLQKQEHVQWEHRLNELRELILEADRAGRLTPERTDALLFGLRRDLAYEYDIRKPVRQKSSKKTATTEEQRPELQS